MIRHLIAEWKLISDGGYGGKEYNTVSTMSIHGADIKTIHT